MSVVTLIFNKCSNFVSNLASYLPIGGPKDRTSRVSQAASLKFAPSLESSSSSRPVPQSTHHVSSSNYDAARQHFGPVVRSSQAQAQPQHTLCQTLQSQVDELECENKSILSEITNSRSGNSEKSIYSVSALHCKENQRSHSELSKLSAQFSNVSEFCNKQMFDILNLVTKGCVELESKLSSLRSKCANTQNDEELYQGIQHIDILEKVVEELKQLESKFQGLQNAGFNAISQKVSFQNKEEAHIDALLEKIVSLNHTKSFLQECKQSLPRNKVYDAEHLKVFITVIENEREMLSQKTRELRPKLNQAERFGRDLTNHLLDYAEILQNYSVKIKNHFSPSPLPPKFERQPLPVTRNIAFHTMNLHSRQTHMKETGEEFDSNELKLAAVEVSKVLTAILSGK